MDPIFGHQVNHVAEEMSLNRPIKAICKGKLLDFEPTLAI
jgi:hypothetical protein